MIGRFALTTIALVTTLTHRADTLITNLTISNNAVRASFDGLTGEFLSLVNLESAGPAADYFTPPAVARAPSPPSPPTHPPQPFCLQQGSGTGPWYMKTGGDPNVTAEWKGPPSDRCCRVKDASGSNCRWYPSQPACEVDLRTWQTVCLSCATNPLPVGCPTWTPPPPPPPGTGHGLFLAWVDAAPPPLAFDAGWAGGTPAPSNGLPPRAHAIAPADCTLASHSISADGAHLSYTLIHPSTTLRFHINASLGAGADGALNLSLHVELPPDDRSSSSSSSSEANAPSPSPGSPARPNTIMTAFPFITGISISGSGSTNVGINHFQTGLATDGASLPAWVPSGGLYGWQASPCTLHLRLRTPQTWPLPSVTAGLGAVLHCTRPVIARTLHPTFTTLTAIRCLTCVLCATTTPCVVNPLSPPCVYLIYSAFCHRM
jgi:hypothetical protein